MNPYRLLALLIVASPPSIWDAAMLAAQLSRPVRKTL